LLDDENIPLFSKDPQIDQIGIIVKDMERSLKLYEQMFGPPFLTLESDVTSGKLKFGLFQVGEIQLELIEVVEGETIHSKFLREKGEGLHHIGFIVEDLEEELIELEKAGISVLERGTVQEMVKFAYLDTEKSLGIILELIQLVL
jgi:catechol 2,3-dioxygenase-like lactoylglutathione lyase family enzyme